LRIELVFAESIKSLKNKVNDYFNDGWRPQGKVSVSASGVTQSNGDPRVIYTQAMVLKERCAATPATEDNISIG